MTLLRPRVIERTPCLMRWRVSARPSYLPSRCLHGSTRLGQTQPTTRPETPTAIIPPPPGPLSRRTSKSKTAPAVHIHRPQVLPPSIDNSAPKIHILGEDEKSKYLAHVLSGLQNSIELLSWRSTPRAKNAKNRYTNVQKRIESGEAKPIIETNRADESPAPTQAKDEPISQLVVTGSGAEAVPALEAVKHRLNNSTTVLLMSDGLGVLEDVRRRVFQNSDASPNFLLGHMSHRLGYNRNHNSVKVLRPGSIKITDKTDIRFGKPRKWVPKMGMHQRFHRTDQLVESFQAADVNAGLTEYDSWLRFKLPSIMFDSVVEPVCVLLDLPYAGLMQNPAARHLLRDLTTEISNLLRHLPEIDRSPVIQAYLDEARLSKELFRAILGKRDQPSKLALQINKGLPTDVNYLHGYYIRRANALGIDVRTSVLVRTIIKAKHSIAIEKRNSWVAFDEMSIPPGEDPFKYRTVPGLHSNRH